MSFLSGIKNFIKTEILGVQETDTKNQLAAKKDTTPVIECETEAPVDKLEKKNTKNSVQSAKTQKGMSRKAMEATIENTPSEHIDIKKMLRKGLIERVTGMTKDDFDKLTPQQKNRVVMAIKTSVEKFDELQKQGKISKKADLEEIVTSFAQILAEALNSGEFKTPQEFEKAMGDFTENFGKDFDKKSSKEQRRIIKEHRLADEKQMRAELEEVKNLPKSERVAAEIKIRNRHNHIRKGRFVDITAQCDSKTAVNSLVILDSKDLQYGAKTVLATRCNAEERTATADYAEYSVTKNIIADYKEIGDEVNSEVLEGYTQTFLEQKSANAVKAYQTDYVKDRDNYEAALAKQKRGEALTAEEKALLDTMKPDYYTATAKGIGSGALNNVNMTNDEKAEFISNWQADAKKYSATIEESEEIDGLLLLLNTVGGDIEAGLAISELIAGMKKPTVSLVLGGGHSIGIPLAVSAKKSMIAPTASMMIHPVRMSGVVVGAPATYHYFQRIQEQITDFVTANSKISREKFSEYMMATGQIATDVGTIVYGREAVESGLIDRLGSLHDALETLHRMIASAKNTKRRNVQKG